MTIGSRESLPQPVIAERLRPIAKALEDASKYASESTTENKIKTLYVNVLWDMGGSPVGLSSGERNEMVQRWQNLMDSYAIDRAKLVDMPTALPGAGKEFKELGNAIDFLRGQIEVLKHPGERETPTITQRLGQTRFYSETLEKAIEVLSQKRMELEEKTQGGGKELGKERLEIMEGEIELVSSHRESLAKYQQELQEKTKALQAEEDEAWKGFNEDLEISPEAIHLTASIATMTRATANPKCPPEKRQLLEKNIRDLAEKLNKIKADIAKKHNLSLPSTD